MSIKLTDIIDYSICPWKLTLSDESPKDSRQVKFYVLADLIKFYLASTYKSKAPSLAALRARLGVYWHEYTKDLTVPVSSDDLLRIEEEVRHIQFILKPGDSIVAVNYPIALQINASVIEHNIDAIILRNNKVKLFYIDTQNYIGRTSSDIDLNIIAYMSYRAIINDLKSKPTSVQFYKPISRTYTKVDFNSEYQSIIESIVKSIELDIYYPRPYNNICKTCTKRSACKFS